MSLMNEWIRNLWILHQFANHTLLEGPFQSSRYMHPMFASIAQKRLWALAYLLSMKASFVENQQGDPRIPLQRLRKRGEWILHVLLL